MRSIIKGVLITALLLIGALFFAPDKTNRVLQNLGIIQNPEQRVTWKENTKPFEAEVRVKTGHVRKESVMEITQSPPPVFRFACSNAKFIGICKWRIEYSYSYSLIDGKMPELVNPTIQAVVDTFYTIHTHSNCESVMINTDLYSTEMYNYFVEREFMDTITVQPDAEIISRQIIETMEKRGL